MQFKHHFYDRFRQTLELGTKLKLCGKSEKIICAIKFNASVGVLVMILLRIVIKSGMCQASADFSQIPILAGLY